MEKTITRVPHLDITTGANERHVVDTHGLVVLYDTGRGVSIVTTHSPGNGELVIECCKALIEFMLRSGIFNEVVTAVALQGPSEYIDYHKD